MQLVGLAVFFGTRQQEPTDAQGRLLRRWLWVSAFTEGFGGQNPSRIHRQLKDIRDRISKDPNPNTIEGVDLAANAHPFPTRFDLRSARVKTLLCVQIWELNRRKQSALAYEFARRVQADSAEALKNIFFSNDFFSHEIAERQLLSSPANRQFIPDHLRKEGGVRRLIFDRISSGKTLKDTQSELGLICFPESIRELSKIEPWSKVEPLSKVEPWSKVELFLREREQALMALEHALMHEVGVTLPRESTAAPSKIDLEEDPPLSTYSTTQLLLPGF